MAPLGPLFPYQWRSYRRGLRGHGIWRIANALAAAAICARLLPPYVRACGAAVAALRTGDVVKGAAGLESILFALMIAWFLAPLFVVRASGEEGAALRTRLGLLPLTGWEHLVSHAAGMLLQPVYWVLVLGSIAVLVPASMLPSGVVGVGAGIVFVALCAFLSWALVLLREVVMASRRGRTSAGLVAAALAVAVIAVIFINVRVGADTLPAGSWARIRGFTPAGWVVRAGTERLGVLWILPLVVSAGLSAVVGMGSLRWTMTHPVVSGRTGVGRRRAIRGIRGMPAPLGAAAEKEFRTLVQSADSYACFLIGLICGAILATWSQFPPWAAWIAVVFTLWGEAAMPMNAFGLDGRAADRYRVLPMTGREVVLSKNAAYAIVAAMQVLPIWIAVAWRKGPALGLGCIVATGSLLLLHVIWGNGVSIRVPAPRGFLSLDTIAQSGGAFCILYLIVVPVLPLGIEIVLERTGPWAALMGQFALFGACLLLYKSALGRQGRLFDREAETMRARLAL